MEPNNANRTTLRMMSRFFLPQQQQYGFPPHGHGGAINMEESVSFDLTAMKAAAEAANGAMHQRNDNNGMTGAAGGNHSNAAQWQPCQAGNYLVPYGYPAAFFNPLNPMQMPPPQPHLLYQPQFLPPAPPQQAPPPPAPTPPSEHQHGFDNSTNHLEGEAISVKEEPVVMGEEGLAQPGPAGGGYREKENPLKFYKDNSMEQTSENQQNQELSNAASLASFGVTAEEYRARCELMEEFKRIVTDNDVDNDTLFNLIPHFSYGSVFANLAVKNNMPVDQIMQALSI